MYQDHSVKTDDEIDALIELLTPHLDAVNMDTDLTPIMKMNFGSSNGVESSEFSKRLMVIRKNGLVTHEQSLKILLRFHLRSDTWKQQNYSNAVDQKPDVYIMKKSEDPLAELRRYLAR